MWFYDKAYSDNKHSTDTPKIINEMWSWNLEKQKQKSISGIQDGAMPTSILAIGVGWKTQALVFKVTILHLVVYIHQSPQPPTCNSNGT